MYKKNNRNQDCLIYLQKLYTVIKSCHLSLKKERSVDPFSTADELSEATMCGKQQSTWVKLESPEFLHEDSSSSRTTYRNPTTDIAVERQSWSSVKQNTIFGGRKLWGWGVRRGDRDERRIYGDGKVVVSMNRWKEYSHRGEAWRLLINKVNGDRGCGENSMNIVHVTVGVVFPNFLSYSFDGIF